MKKIITLLVLFVVIVGVFVGCSKEDYDKTEYYYQAIVKSVTYDDDSNPTSMRIHIYNNIGDTTYYVDGNWDFNGFELKKDDVFTYELHKERKDGKTREYYIITGVSH